MSKYSKKHSFRSYQDKKFLSSDPSEFSNTIIKCSNFYQQKQPDTCVFPDGVKNLTLENCNLDNVCLTSEMITIGGTRKRIVCQNDMEDWIVDEFNYPLEPLHKENYQELNLDFSPKNIPDEPMEESIVAKEMNRLNEASSWLRLHIM